MKLNLKHTLMKKKHILLTGLIFTSAFGFAQSKIAAKKFETPHKNKIQSTFNVQEDLKNVKFKNKAFRDTLFYEDFAGGLPLNWSIVNYSPNNFQWVWNTVAVNGQSTIGFNAINSTTAANGFMSLPSGFYNTPRPTLGSVAMDTYFESDTVFIPAGKDRSIWLSYQQFLVYCCRPSTTTAGANAVRLMLQVSTDNFVTSTNFDATDGLGVNTTNTTNAAAGRTNEINISSATVGNTSFKFRFYADGNTNYFWYIDDIAVIEGPANDMEIRTPYLEFNFDYAYNPFYGQIPFELFTPLPASAFLYNNGGNDLTGVKIEADISHIADPSGAPGTGLVYSTSSTPVPLQSGAIRNIADYTVTNSPRFVPGILGDFRLNMIATSDSVDENIGNESYSQTFTTTDTIFARDDNGIGGGTGVGNYVGAGTAVGDRCGTMYIVESRTGATGTSMIPTSITFAVSADSSNVGVEIVPKIWSYNEDSLFSATGSIAAAFSGGEVASAFIPITILPSHLNTLLTLPLDNGPATINGLDSGQYVVGWEVTNTNGGFSFEVQADPSSGQFQDNVTTFIDIASSPAGWGWAPIYPVIRLNLGNLVTTSIKSVADSNLNISVQPNPSNGEFTLKLKTSEKTTFQLRLVNSLGQLVHTETMKINGIESKHFNFSHLDKGIYHMSLQNDKQKIVKTVVIH